MNALFRERQTSQKAARYDKGSTGAGGFGTAYLAKDYC